MATHRRRRTHADLCADGFGQDAHGVPHLDRPAHHHAAARGSHPSHARALHLAAARPGVRHREEPAGAAQRDRTGGRTVGGTLRRPRRRDAHGRHGGQRPAEVDPSPARPVDHHARVALPDAHVVGARDARRRRDRDHRRDPRHGRDQARCASRPHPRTSRTGHRTPAPADRPVGHPAPARGGRRVPRRLRRARCEASGGHRRRGHPQGAGDRSGHPGRGHVATRSGHGRAHARTGLGRAHRTAQFHLAEHLPRDPHPHPRQPLDDHLLQRPPRHRAARGEVERALRRTAR